MFRIAASQRSHRWADRRRVVTTLLARALQLTAVPSTRGADESSPLTITTQPGTVEAVAGDDATLLVVAVGEGDLNYQWRFGGLPVAGATGPILTLTDVEMADAGLYDVAPGPRCRMAARLWEHVRACEEFRSAI